MHLVNVPKRVGKAPRRAALAALAALWLAGGPARAQQPAPLTDEQLRAVIQQQQQQIRALTEAVQALQGQRPSPTAAPADAPAPTDADMRKVVQDEMKKKEDADKKKKEEEEAKKKEKLETEGYRVGSDLSLKAGFEDGLFLWMRTPNNDFTMHIGGWYQFDNVFWNQAVPLRAPPGARPGAAQGVASGAALGGIGTLEDGQYWRRIRPFVEGAFWETYEYRFNLALENDQFSTSGLDEFWVGVNKLPLLGTIRVGHFKDALGVEGDNVSSSRAMTFMERSAYSESIEENENFVQGIWALNQYLDDRLTSSVQAFRVDNGQSSGAVFGDGQWGAQARLTCLPIYDCDGRHLLHLGLSGGWRNGNNNIVTSPFRTFQLRTRPALRDDDPAAQGGTPAAPVAGGAQTIPNANSNRLIDTGVMAGGNASDQFLMGTEILYILGPFSFQAEYGFTRINDIIGFAPSGLRLNPGLAAPQDYTFHGGYVQLAYTLTGENRAYDRKLGALDRYYYGKQGPYAPFWLTRDDEGHITSTGLGAMELACRFNYVDLNDGTGANRIGGGILKGFDAAFNWYLNNNLCFMFDWVYDDRSSLPTVLKGAPTAANTTLPGWTSGFGTRMQLSF
jgi:phosphate-selective porin